MSADKRQTDKIRKLLLGGDRRSIAKSNRVLEIIRTEPALVSELAVLASDDDWIVSLRALDALEKLAHERADWVAPHKAIFIGKLADSDKWEIQLQIVRALPLLHWSRSQRRRVIDILIRNVEHEKLFVKAWALDSLAMFALEDRKLLGVVRAHLLEFDRSGSKSLAARARHIRHRLSSYQRGGEQRA